MGNFFFLFEGYLDIVSIIRGPLKSSAGESCLLLAWQGGWPQPGVRRFSGSASAYRVPPADRPEGISCPDEPGTVLSLHSAFEPPGGAAATQAGRA